MKNTFLLLVITGLFITGNQSLTAQEAVASKQFYTEMGGPGVIMSANFDGRFKSNVRLGWGYRLGAGFSVGKFEELSADGLYEDVHRTIYTFPAGLNYVFGRPDRTLTFEVGAGATYLSREVSIFNWDVEKPGHVIGFVTFMFRRTPVNGGFSFRIGFTPIIGTAGDMMPSGAIGFGYAF